MNYLWNVDLIEIENNTFLAKNWVIGVLVLIFNGNTNQKQENLFIYKNFNVRDWKETNYWFFNINDYKLFLNLKNNIKWINTSLVAEFSTLSDLKKELVINWKETIKGLWKANLEKIKTIYKKIERNNEIDIKKIFEIKEFLKDISNDEKTIDNFINNNYEDLIELTKIEILNKFREEK